MSLITKINNEDMVDISINVDKFTGILKLLNEHQKEQEQKLIQFELKIDELIKESQNSTFKDDITLRVENLEAKVKFMEEEIQKVTDHCNEKIEDSTNEIIVQQKIANRNMYDEFQSNLHHMTECIQEIKKSTEEIFPKDINDLNVRLKHLYSKVLNEQSANENTNNDFNSKSDNHESTTNNDILNNEDTTDTNDKNKSESILNIQDISSNQQIQDNKSDLNEGDDILTLKSKYIEILTTTNYNKSALNQLAAQLEKLSQKVDGLYTPNISQRTLDIPNRNRRNNSLDPTFDAQQTLSGINGIMSMLNNKIGKQQEEIDEMKNIIFRNDSIERPIFYALIDALKLIHSHADGMEEIPVQNFETVSPEYFKSDPDFQSKICRYCSRFPPKRAKPSKGLPYIDEEEECNVDVKNNDSKIENEEGSEKVKSFKIEKENNSIDDELPSPPPPCKKVKQISGLLHLVSSHTSHQEPSHNSTKNNTLLQAQFHAQMQAQIQSQIQTQVQDQVKAQLQALAEEAIADKENTNIDDDEKCIKGITIEQTKTVINNFKNNKIEILGRTGRPKPVLSRTINVVIADMEIGESICPIGESEISTRMRDLSFMLGQFKREKDDLISSIDRKIDRDFVERLFNKFRVILNDMNEKVIKIQNGSEKYATINQIEEVFRMIESVKSSIQSIVANNINNANSNNNSHKDEAAAGKRSCQECLFCGRKISLVAGGISTRSLGSYEESSQFVYGEGGVFKKAFTIGPKQSETKTTNLPPLNGGSS